MSDTQPVQQTAQSAAMQKFYSEARQATTQLAAAHQKLVALQSQWNNLDYGNTLEPGDGIHFGLTGVEIGAVVFDTANAVTAVMTAGHGTNVSRLL
jgi:hypothetical protein